MIKYDLGKCLRIFETAVIRNNMRNLIRKVT